jgi:hypothetical protein
MPIAQLLALVLSALALVPAGAHLFALPNKIGLAQTDYFIVQNIYRGWALFGIVLFGALAATLVLAVLVRRQRAPFLLTIASFVCQAVTLALFFAFVYPANVATNNWTVIPDNWEALRWQWEAGHAVNAGITFIGFCALVLGVVLSRSESALPHR